MVLPLGADFTLESFASPWFCLLLAGNSRQRVRTSIVNVDQKSGGELGQSPLNKKSTTTWISKPEVNYIVVDHHYNNRRRVVCALNDDLTAMTVCT